MTVGTEKRRRQVNVSLAPSVADILDSLKEYEEQTSSEVIRRLILDEKRRREVEATA